MDINYKKLALSIGLSLLAGAIGSIFTIPNIDTWYATIEKPWFVPPNWLFGPVWTSLYILIGVAFYMVWTSISNRPKKGAYIVFGLQFGLNILWSIAFFGLHQLWLAVGVIALLIIFIILTINESLQYNRWAGYILLPYFVWVAYATILTVAIALLNT